MKSVGGGKTWRSRHRGAYGKSCRRRRAARSARQHRAQRLSRRRGALYGGARQAYGIIAARSGGAGAAASTTCGIAAPTALITASKAWRIALWRISTAAQRRSSKINASKSRCASRGEMAHLAPRSTTARSTASRIGNRGGGAGRRKYASAAAACSLRHPWRLIGLARGDAAASASAVWQSAADQIGGRLVVICASTASAASINATQIARASAAAARRNKI